MSFLLNPFVFAGAAGDFESIATVTVGSGGVSAVDFTSITGTYQHLQVRGIIALEAGSYPSVSVRLNGSSASSYAWHRLSGTGSVAEADSNSSQTSAVVLTATSKASTFGGFVLDILDYANTSKATTLRCFGGSDGNGDGFVRVTSGLWTPTDAVTDIKVIHTGGTDIAQHSTFALYGIKAS